MITVISLLYCACVYLAFKIIKIKVKPSTLAVAVVIGVFLLGGIVICWKQAAPLTDQMTLKRNVVQITGLSKEVVKKLYVKPDQKLKKGEILFEVDTTPFQNTVDQLTADLAVAEANLSVLTSAIDVASAGLEKSQANEAYAKIKFDTALNVHKLNPSAIAKIQITVAEESFLSSQAAVGQAAATLKQAKATLASSQASIAAIQAQIDTAKYQLELCTVRAPCDGHVINWQLREGSMMTTLNAAPVGLFMDMSESVVGAVLPMNQLKNVKPGDQVEIAFKSLPGRIMTGKVDTILEYTGEGQLAPSGILPEAIDIGSKGFLAVRILLDDQEQARKLPLGAAGTTTIYTDFGKPFHIISKITIRIKGWMYYIPI